MALPGAISSSLVEKVMLLTCFGGYLFAIAAILTVLTCFGGYLFAIAAILTQVFRDFSLLS
jgi:hypothetical protein